MKERNGLKGQQEWRQDWGEGTMEPVCDLVSRERRPPSHTHPSSLSSLVYAAPAWRGPGWRALSSSKYLLSS